MLSLSKWLGILIGLLISFQTFADGKPMRCVAFSPYVGGLTPDYGARPSKQLVDTLLDKLVADTPFRCIMTYGVINGLEYVFEAAMQRQLSVTAIVWLDKEVEVNSQSISSAIALARKYDKTITRLSCGSEVRTRHDYRYDSEISRCLQAMREAKLSQPVTTIDTWWEWCNRQQPCAPTSFSAQVDWIGINVFPWWESQFSPIHSCISAEQAAQFHLARLEEVRRANPGKDVVITEFGWPNAPENYAATNRHTGQQCAVAGVANQALVINSTLALLGQKGYSATVFEAFSETWKPSNEGESGQYWGVCQGEPPYRCNAAVLMSLMRNTPRRK
ncbi:exo-beta-1,3-glucanase [Methylocucumis oryzae]|uniref:exo-beta-1,3-glucanase n=1 Tax=Methylocucumis oryzae TaxID=1632867 RepID=UPI00069737F1|nr:exo-beta-1,3-glucanase [Methylocucumis oryzae]